jgi:hypothetical protein
MYAQSKALVESSIGLGGRDPFDWFLSKTGEAVHLAAAGAALRSMRPRDCLRMGAERNDMIEEYDVGRKEPAESQNDLYISLSPRIAYLALAEISGEARFTRKAVTWLVTLARNAC